MKINEKDLLIVSCLRQNARIKLTEMSRTTRIPVSTLFDKTTSITVSTKKDACAVLCGPPVMIKFAVRPLEEKLGFKPDQIFLSLERMMGCGIGLCQSCAVELRTDDGETEYKLCCKDGPIFDSKETVFVE